MLESCLCRREKRRLSCVWPQKVRVGYQIHSWHMVWKKVQGQNGLWRWKYANSFTWNLWTTPTEVELVGWGVWGVSPRLSNSHNDEEMMRCWITCVSVLTKQESQSQFCLRTRKTNCICHLKKCGKFNSCPKTRTPEENLPTPQDFSPDFKARAKILKDQDSPY